MSHRSLAAVRFAALALALAGCSESPETGGTGGAGGGGPGPETTKVDYSFQFTTPSGEETHWCQYTRLPEGDGSGVSITGYSWTWENMHHWALYRTTPDLPADVPLDQPFDCFQPGAMKYAQPASLVLAAGDAGEQMFPEGTGFTFQPGEIVIFQAHTVNVTSGDLPISLEVTLDTVDPSAVPNPLGLLQFYDPYIVVPAHTQARAQMRCRIPKDMTVLFGTTHQHTRGVGVDVFLDEGDARAEEPFLSSTDWEHPTVLEAPMKLPAGSHVRTVCDYLGDDNDTYQGQNRDTSEMCMYIGYYYPALSPEEGAGLFENCVQDSIPGGVGDEFGAGDKSCPDSLACIQACPPGDAPNPGDGRIDVGECWQKCLVGSCPSATGPLNDLGYCVQTQCAEACSGGDCASCVVANCGGEYAACQSAKCQ